MAALVPLAADAQEERGAAASELGHTQSPTMASTPKHEEDEAPISLKALDAVRRCAETEMRRRLDDPNTTADQQPSSKRARVDKGGDGGKADDTTNGGDRVSSPEKFREVARFGYAAVDALYGGGGDASASTAASTPPAFLATCDLRHEKSAIREAERLLGYVDERLTPVKLACRGVALLLAPPSTADAADADTANPAAASLAAADRVLASVEDGTLARPRFCHRIQPVAVTCSAVDPDAVARAAKRVCEEAAAAAARASAASSSAPPPTATTATTTKFSVVFKARHDGVGAPGASLRASVIKAVAAAMGAAFSASSSAAGGVAVDLKRPDVVLLADVLPVAARPKEPLLVLSAVPARMCVLGSSNTHFRALTEVGGGNRGGGGGGAGKACSGGDGGGGGKAKNKADAPPPAARPQPDS